MDLYENLKNNIQRLRKERNITQDILAVALEISVQAVSKWETGASLPDIMQLPRIARFFGVTIDYLFYSEGKEQAIVNGALPDDDILRIVQFRGNKMLGIDQWERDIPINIRFPSDVTNNKTKTEFKLEIWGNADINGDIAGYVECGGDVNCSDVGSYVECGGDVNCGDVGSYVECGGCIECGDVGNYVECDGGVNCGNVNGKVECNGDLTCNNIGYQVDCQGNIHCKEIHGSVNCEGNITYDTVK